MGFKLMTERHKPIPDSDALTSLPHRP